jgi:helix-turn-helix protein
LAEWFDELDDIRKQRLVALLLFGRPFPSRFSLLLHLVNRPNSQRLVNKDECSSVLGMDTLGNANHIGQNVGRLRYQKGWTQDVLAAKMQLLGCDVTRDVIANIENRRSAVNDNQIVFLAEALGVEIGDLFPRKLPGSSTVIAPKPAAARR